MIRRHDPPRRLGLLLLLLSLLLALAAGVAHAQSADAAAQLRAEARMAPGGPLMAGATSVLQVDVLTSTWFTQPPQLPALDVPGALVSGPSGQATIIRATIGGVAYNGLRFSYLVSPVAAGPLRIPVIHVSAQVGQASAPLAAQTRALELRAAGPPGGLAGHALAASAVQAAQQIQFSAQPPAVGDRVSRVITIEAQGAQAMLIPPPVAAVVPGLKLYPSDPQLAPISDSRGGFVGGRRVDRLDYVIERAGAYELPAVEIRWWNIAANKEERAELPAQRFEAQAGAAYQTPFSVEQDLRDMGRRAQLRIPEGWLALGGGLAVAALAGWLAAPWIRRAFAGMQSALRARRQRWRESESYAAMRLQRLLAQPQPRLDALYTWLRRACGTATLARATASLGPALRQPGADALRACYGREPDAERGWRGLREVFPRLRRALRAPRHAARSQCLLALNPRPAKPSRGTADAASGELPGDLP